MSIELDLRIWNIGKADDRWTDFLDKSPEDREKAEPHEQVESVLEIMDQPDAPQEWRTGRLAMLDLAFGQVGDPLPIHNIETFEPLCRFLLYAFVDLGQEDSRRPSYRLLFDSLNFGQIISLDEQTVRKIASATFDSISIENLKNILEPVAASKDYAFERQFIDVLVAFWKELLPFFRKAQEAGAWRDEALIIETVNGEVDHPYLLERAARHEKWLHQPAG